jgi:hypothetical protein
MSDVKPVTIPVAASDFFVMGVVTGLLIGVLIVSTAEKKKKADDDAKPETE